MASAVVVLGVLPRVSLANIARLAVLGHCQPIVYEVSPVKSLWLLIFLAQHVHTRPLYVEPITIAPPLPTRTTMTDNEVARIPPALPIVIPAPVAAPTTESWWDAHPWWPFVVGLTVWWAVAAYRGRRERLSLPGRREPDDEPGELPDGHYGPPRPTTAQWHMMEALADGVPVPLARRSLEDCRTLYIDTVRAQVRRMIGRPDIRCVLVPTAPLETRWRAWLGTTDWATANPDLRATGRSEGQALKRLLAAYQAFGSNWMGFAVERERPELSRSSVD